eukprot:3269474-Alexandrium_andersonii.AAC.1
MALWKTSPLTLPPLVQTGVADMQQGQAGKAQRRGRKAALKEAWRKERQEQQWWAARPWVPNDVWGGNTAVQ